MELMEMRFPLHFGLQLYRYRNRVAFEGETNVGKFAGQRLDWLYSVLDFICHAESAPLILDMFGSIPFQWKFQQLPKSRRSDIVNFTTIWRRFHFLKSG
jgi:hypothetical protein